jgi:hypothetical protein
LTDTTRPLLRSRTSTTSGMPLSSEDTLSM